MKPKWHGILIINKERGMTSHAVVANLRRILKQKEIGHTGTLDPEATGVLVVGLGQATRSFSFLDENIKIYQAEIILGQSTDTQDATGNIIQENTDFRISLNQLQIALTQLTGDIWQIPPMYSAVKVNGQKLYDLARQGLEVERKSRLIKVLEWDIFHTQEIYSFRNAVPVEVVCSKGTYIRTLIHDLGNILRVGAHMGSLIRLQSGNFTLNEAFTLSQVQESFVNGDLSQKIVTIDRALQHIPNITITDNDQFKIIHGGKISFDKYSLSGKPGLIAKAINSNGLLLAILQLARTESYLYWQPIRVFKWDEKV